MMHTISSLWSVGIVTCVVEDEVKSIDWKSVPVLIETSGTFTLMLEDVTETSLAGSKTLTWILFPLNIDCVVIRNEEVTEYKTHQIKNKGSI